MTRYEFEQMYSYYLTHAIMEERRRYNHEYYLKNKDKYYNAYDKSVRKRKLNQDATISERYTRANQNIANRYNNNPNRTFKDFVNTIKALKKK